MKMYKRIVAAMLAGLMFTGLSACEKEGSASNRWLDWLNPCRERFVWYLSRLFSSWSQYQNTGEKAGLMYFQ